MIEKPVQPTYKRQRFLLSFISQLEDSIAQTHLQKLIFLYSMKENSNYYEFVPYKYGPFSFQLREDVSILRKNGFISNDSPYIRATRKYFAENISATSIASERGDELVRKAYREYPYYTIHSEIITRLFRDEPGMVEKLEEEKNCYTQTEQILFTIGYEGRSLEAFMNVLVRNNIRLLCDVRKNPYSRKYGFSKELLEQVTGGLKIKYVHIPALGIESAKRKSLNTVEDYRTLFQDYEKNLSQLEPQLESLYSSLQNETRIALLCFESDPIMCHRHVIRDYLCAKYPIRSVDL